MERRTIDGLLLKKMIIYGHHLLENNKEMVDALNVFPVPDGDTGTNMSLTMGSAVKEVSSVINNRVESVTEGMATGSLMGARGNSGVILSQIFRGFDKGCKGKDKLTTIDLAYAFKMAADTAYKAVIKPIEGTILTVVREIGERAIKISKSQENVDEFLYELIKYGEKVLNQTPEMLKPLKEAGVVDAGGKGFIVILQGFYEAIIGKEAVFSNTNTISPKNMDLKEHTKGITYGYCTEFIIKGKNIDTEKFKEKIRNLGDCMLVVGNENIVKVHIHTNNPGTIIESGLRLGELIDIKIDNMRQQHKNKVFEDTSNEFGIITVAMGEGIINIFKDLNVDEIIIGGQTMNPSTEDIKSAIDRIHAKHIFILPNNKNIILAANQAKEISNKNVTVIPSKTIPQGMTAMLAFNGEASVQKNTKLMEEALANVKTGQVTYSVRDTQLNGVSIQKGDILGIADGDICEIGQDIEDVAYRLLENMITKDTEVLTIFYGDESSEEKARKLGDQIEEKYDDIDIEIHPGNQPIYYYIFSVE